MLRFLNVMQDSIKNGGNRLFGTLIGGLLSIVVFWIYLLFYPQGGHSVFLAVLLGLVALALALVVVRGGLQRQAQGQRTGAKQENAGE